MNRFSSRRAYVLSFAAHALLWTLLLRYETRVHTARVVRERTAAAARHAPALQRNQAHVDADRLRRIREIADRLSERGQRRNDGAGTAQSDTAASRTDAPPGAPRAEAAAAAPPAKAAKPESIDALYAQGRRDYEAARQQFIAAEAKRLAKITGQDLDSARRTVEAAQPRRERDEANTNGARRNGSAGSNAAKAGHGAAGNAAAELEWMQADAQRLLQRAVELQQQEGSGATVSAEAQRQAYELLNESQQFAADAKEFAPAVDWTALMGHPLSTTSLYGTPGGAGASLNDYRRIEPEAERTLRARFRQKAHPILFTRHIGRHGTVPADWVAPDSWYVIGPFENGRREAIDRSFPPEIEIDRDATYTGKGGRPIAWEYVRVHDVGVIPPHPEEYAVYYAYTEVRADQPMDCWLALGSDDHSKLWINGLMIWSDTRAEKEWAPTEGFRRVHLEPGVNRFLLRLENGWRGTMFSVALLLP